MNEKLQGLKETLHELEAELAERDNLDDRTRRMLEEAAEEIENALAELPDSAEGDDAELGEELEGEGDEVSEEVDESFSGSGSPRARLEKAIGQFETSHPTLYGLMNRLMDALGQMGI